MSAMDSGVGHGGHLFLEPGLSLVFRVRFAMLLETAGAGIFPEQSQEQLVDIRKYVEMLNRDPGIVHHAGRQIEGQAAAFPLDDAGVYALACSLIFVLSFPPRNASVSINDYGNICNNPPSG